MAGSGETITYRELEARSNRLAHLLRAAGLRRLDHYAIFMENHPRYIECCAAGERSGLYYTAVNSFLTAPELAYIVNNSQSKALIASQAKREIALAALADCPSVELCLIVDGPGEGVARAQSRRGDSRISRNPDRRRAARSGDALFLGHHRKTQGRAASAARPVARRAVVGAGHAAQRLAVSRGPGLPLARAALSLGAAGRGRRHDQARGDGRRHGAFRRGAFPRARRALSRHPCPARADHVLAHAEAAGPIAPGL